MFESSTSCPLHARASHLDRASVQSINCQYINIEVNMLAIARCQKACNLECKLGHMSTSSSSHACICSSYEVLQSRSLVSPSSTFPLSSCSLFSHSRNRMLITCDTPYGFPLCCGEISLLHVTESFPAMHPIHTSLSLSLSLSLSDSIDRFPHSVCIKAMEQLLDLGLVRYADGMSTNGVASYTERQFRSVWDRCMCMGMCVCREME